MDDAQLEARGVAALGARRKMLKTFERVRAHCDAKVRKDYIHEEEKESGAHSSL